MDDDHHQEEQEVSGDQKKEKKKKEQLHLLSTYNELCAHILTAPHVPHCTTDVGRTLEVHFQKKSL